MAKNDVTTSKPIVLDLGPATYYRCTCGKSAKMPFCDGAHAGSGCTPIQFELKEQQTVYLCNCGKTANAPFCDGSCVK